MKSELRDTKNASRKQSFRFWFYVGLAATLLVWSSAADAAEVSVSDADGNPWTIAINPGPAGVAVASPERLLPPLPEEPAAQTELASVGVAEQTFLAPAATSLVQEGGLAIHPLYNGATVDGRSYADVYRSIPYSKTEYYANPGYRHDATMEILFGQLRPGGAAPAQGRVIENPVYSPYRPYLFAHWDYYQTSTLLRPRVYFPLYGASCCY